mgnify:CR=1 FL=1
MTDKIFRAPVGLQYHKTKGAYSIISASFLSAFRRQQ